MVEPKLAALFEVRGLFVPVFMAVPNVFLALETLPYEDGGGYIIGERSHENKFSTGLIRWGKMENFCLVIADD